MRRLIFCSGERFCTNLYQRRVKHSAQPHFLHLAAEDARRLLFPVPEHLNFFSAGTEDAVFILGVDGSAECAYAVCIAGFFHTEFRKVEDVFKALDPHPAFPHSLTSSLARPFPLGRPIAEDINFMQIIL